MLNIESSIVNEMDSSASTKFEDAVEITPKQMKKTASMKWTG